MSSQYSSNSSAINRIPIRGIVMTIAIVGLVGYGIERSINFLGESKELYAKTLDKMDKNHDNIMQRTELADLLRDIGWPDKVPEGSKTEIDYDASFGWTGSYVGDFNGVFTVVLGRDDMIRYLSKSR